MLRYAIINGPNLNLTGEREPDVYGTLSFEDAMMEWEDRFREVAMLIYLQSNIEGELVSMLQACNKKFDGIILNAGAYSHTSIALGDAIRAIKTPVLEVHLSNVYGREEYRKNSFIAAACIGTISGLGLMGYELALEYFIDKKLNPKPS